MGRRKSFLALSSKIFFLSKSLMSIRFMDCMVCLVYLYFNVNEFLVPVYKMKLADGAHLSTLFSGGYAFLFWFVQIVGLVLPIVLIVLKPFRKPYQGKRGALSIKFFFHF